jgi:hypothetical protein
VIFDVAMLTQKNSTALQVWQTTGIGTTSGPAHTVAYDGLADVIGFCGKLLVLSVKCLVLWQM